MKTFITIITTLAIAGTCFAKDLQSEPLSADDSRLLKANIERIQSELEERHFNSVRGAVRDEIARSLGSFRIELPNPGASLASRPIPLPEPQQEESSDEESVRSRLG